MEVHAQGRYAVLSGPLNVLAFSGSLRAASINTAFCRAAARLAPPQMKIVLFDGLGELPLFNADLEADLPPHVVALRSAVSRADALLVASPEYAHGVSGVMKNALDWLVGADDFAGKPVALVNAAPRAHHAYESLHEILRTMSAALVGGACLTVPLTGSRATEEGMLGSPEICTEIKRALDALAAR